MKKTWKKPVKILEKAKTPRLLVYVNIINANILKTKHNIRSILQLTFWRKNEAQIEPNECPRKTMLPKIPKPPLSKLNWDLIATEHAGNTPLSKFVNKFEKNYTHIK